MVKETRATAPITNSKSILPTGNTTMILYKLPNEVDIERLSTDEFINFAGWNL